MSIDDAATGQDVELILNAWRKHTARTGKNETLLHYIHSQLCADCRAKYAPIEQPVERKSTHFYHMMQHREAQKYARGGLDVLI